MGHQKAPDFPRNQVLFFTFWAIISMGQNLGQGMTQTVTHTPIGRNGADSMGRLFRGSHPLSSTRKIVRNTTLRWRCGMPVRIWPRCGSFSKGRRKRHGKSRLGGPKGRTGSCQRERFICSISYCSHYPNIW